MRPGPTTVSLRRFPAARGTPGVFFFPEVLFSLLVVGTLFVNFGPANLGVADGVLLLVTIVYLPAVIHFRNPQLSAVWRSFGIPALCYLMLGLVLLVTLGGNPVTWAKDLFSFVYLFVGLALLLLTDRTPRLVLPKFTVVICIFGLLLDVAFLDPASRSSGTFENPNLTGSWFAAAFILLLVLGYPQRLPLRVLVLGSAFWGLLFTASMGAIAALTIATVFIVLVWLRVPVWAQIVGLLAALGAAYALLPLLMRLTPYYAATGVDRFSRSSGFRTYLWETAFTAWQDQPMGLGPGGFSLSRAVVLAVNGAETHNDYLGVLVDYGLIGLIIWLIALVGLFRVAGRARPVVVFMAALSLSHSALNFRHLWVFLALGIGASYWAQFQGDNQTADLRAGEPNPAQAASRLDTTAGAELQRTATHRGLPQPQQSVFAPLR